MERSKFILLFFLCFLLFYFATDQTDSKIKQLTIIGTESERSLEEFLGSIKMISEKSIDVELVKSISALIRYKPGVSVSGTSSKFGQSISSLRGIEGDIVQILVNEMRLSIESNIKYVM